MKSQELMWNWKLRKHMEEKETKKQQLHYFSILMLQAGENHCRNKFQSIPTLSQLENVSGMKHSLLWSTLSKYFPCPELPQGAQIHNPLQEFSCAGPLPSCHPSITQQLPTIYQSCFLPISFLKPLAKGCKYYSLFPLASRAWHSSSLPALNYQTFNYYRSKWHKILCI